VAHSQSVFGRRVARGRRNFVVITHHSAAHGEVMLRCWKPEKAFTPRNVHRHARGSAETFIALANEKGLRLVRRPIRFWAARTRRAATHRRRRHWRVVAVTAFMQGHGTKVGTRRRSSITKKWRPMFDMGPYYLTDVVNSSPPQIGR
jgi:hypothetical protein